MDGEDGEIDEEVTLTASSSHFELLATPTRNIFVVVGLSMGAEPISAGSPSAERETFTVSVFRQD